MPKRIAPLSEMQVRNSKPQAKQVTLFDGGGLFLLVTPTGGKLWRFKYRYQGKEKIIALGAYPEISLSVVYRIKLNAKHDLPTRYATLAHELGHVYCGHVGGDPMNRWPCRTRLPLPVQELEAEAVAWLVCQRNGVRTKSKEYLQSLIREADLAQVSMYVIFEAANKVESRTIPK